MITPIELLMIQKQGVIYASKQWRIYWVDAFHDIAVALVKYARWDEQKDILE